MPIQKLRTAMICIALGVTALSVPAFAHGDPTEMGAGPGTDADHHGKDEGSTESAQSAEMQDLMDEGATPMIPDRSLRRQKAIIWTGWSMIMAA